MESFNYPITASLPLRKHTQTHTILNPPLNNSSRHWHTAMAMQTDMEMVTRSRRFPHHFLQDPPAEGMHRRAIVCGKLAIPAASEK
jgi:hypothetical protein